MLVVERELLVVRLGGHGEWRRGWVVGNCSRWGRCRLVDERRVELRNLGGGVGLMMRWLVACCGWWVGSLKTALN